MTLKASIAFCLANNVRVQHSELPQLSKFGELCVSEHSNGSGCGRCDMRAVRSA